MSLPTPVSSLARHPQFECPLSLEPLTSQDATVISCGHHFTKQGVYDYLNSIFGGIISTISDLFAESFQERLQTTVVNCPVCAKRIRSVSDDPQFREMIGIIEMLSSIAIPSSAVASAAAASSALSAEAPSSVEISPPVPSPVTIQVYYLYNLSRYTYHVSRNEKFSRIWKNIKDNLNIPILNSTTAVNSRVVYPWEPISSYVPTEKNELTIHLNRRFGGTIIPEFINDLARSNLGPTASADAIYNLSVTIYDQAILASLQKLEE